MPESGWRQMSHTWSAIAAEHRAGVAVERVVPLAVEPRGLEQRAVDVVLRLLDRAVADAHRPRSAIAGESDAALGGADAAVEPIQHVELRHGRAPSPA